VSATPPRPERPDRDRRAPGVDDFARSVHASYLSRWLRHDPAALEDAAREEATKRKRRRRTSAA
jgi:hypothetical protein